MAKFEKTLKDPESGEQAFIKSNDYFLFQQKIEKQLEKWSAKNTKARGVDKAQELTEEAQMEQQKYRNILLTTLEVDDKIEWDSLTDKTTFHHFSPHTPENKEFFFKEVPRESWIEKIIPYFTSRRIRLEAEAQKKYDTYKAKFDSSEAERLDKYNADKAKFEESQNVHNSSILQLKSGYEAGNSKSIETYINMVLEKSLYPDSISTEHSIEYVPGSMVLKIETVLPNIEDLNFLSEAKYIPSKDDFQLKQLSKGDVKSLYSEVLNQIVLRTIHEIFESEHVGHIQRIEFEGVLKGIDPKTGRDATACHIKLGVERTTFTKIDLSKIDSEACLTGLGASFGKDNSFKKKAA